MDQEYMIVTCNETDDSFPMDSGDVKHFSDDEWSPLKEVLVGRAKNSCFPYEPMKVLANIVPRYYLDCFTKPNNPFPEDIVRKADEELDGIQRALESFGVKVHRVSDIDWVAEGGYTGSMLRDGLMVVGNTIFISAFSWNNCRGKEIELLHGDMLRNFEEKGIYRVVRPPTVPEPDTIYDVPPGARWAINESRVAFDCADFMRCGDFLVTHLSNTTNQRGIEFVRSHLPDGYKLLVFEGKNSKEMHIDVTFLPLGPGTALYNPTYVDLEELRRHRPLDTWRLLPAPYHPKWPQYPTPFMCSEWDPLNVLVVDGKHVLVDKDETQMHDFFRRLDMIPVPLPIKHVSSLGGAFHCSTVDLRRESPRAS